MKYAIAQYNSSACGVIMWCNQANLIKNEN